MRDKNDVSEKINNNIYSSFPSYSDKWSVCALCMLEMYPCQTDVNINKLNKRFTVVLLLHDEML